jgi:hypothetical protein
MLVPNVTEKKLIDEWWMKLQPQKTKMSQHLMKMVLMHQK